MKVFFLPLLFIFLTFSVQSQRAIQGVVKEVHDGKTITVQVGNQTFKIILESIETPNVNQPLHDIVRNHLANKVLGKPVNLRITNIGKALVFQNEINISLQMIRDGAAWYDRPNSFQDEPEWRIAYIENEELAKKDSIGIWADENLLTPWDLRDLEVAKQKAEIEEERKRQEEINSKNRTLKQNTLFVQDTKLILPEKIPNTNYIDYSAKVPNGYVVVAVGYLSSEQDKQVKGIKRPAEGDVICTGYEIPATWVSVGFALSAHCQSRGFTNNATYIRNAKTLSDASTKDIIEKTIIAYRMFKVSGNYEEFEHKANSAINASNVALMYVQDGEIQRNLNIAVGALQDSMFVRNSRRGRYGTGLSGSILLALIDKYGLNDVSETLLDGEIIAAGRVYMNRATLAASRKGIVKLK